jgi:hypothetical protein
MSNSNLFKLFLFSIAIANSPLLAAQSVHFNYTDGTLASYNLEDVKKITFDSDVMNLHLQDGSFFSWNVSTIGFYQYDETTINTSELINLANAWEVGIFPNPTSTYLNVRFNLPHETEISISLFDVQGKLILTKDLGEKKSGEHIETLDLKNLAQGKYVCRISSPQNAISKQVIIN